VGEVVSSNLVVPTILLFLCFERLQQNQFFRTPHERLSLMRSLLKKPRG
jgi:hypothetical protein